MHTLKPIYLSPNRIQSFDFLQSYQELTLDCRGKDSGSGALPLSRSHNRPIILILVMKLLALLIKLIKYKTGLQCYNIIDYLTANNSVKNSGCVWLFAGCRLGPVGSQCWDGVWRASCILRRCSGIVTYKMECKAAGVDRGRNWAMMQVWPLLDPLEAPELEWPLVVLVGPKWPGIYTTTLISPRM